MICTGVIRRIDELGRIVIPKEIRKTLYIKNGDSLEIHVEKESIILKKYSELSGVNELIKKIVNELATTFSLNITIFDKDSILIDSSKLFENFDYTKIINEIYLNRMITTIKDIKLEGELYDIYLYPIIVSSDIIGIIAIESNCLTEDKKNMAKFINNIICKKIDIT